MVKGSRVVFPRMRASTGPPVGGGRSATARFTHCGQVATLRGRPHRVRAHSYALTCTTQRTRANSQERDRFRTSSSLVDAGGPAIMVDGGLGLPGAGVGGPRHHCCRSTHRAADATGIRLMVSPSAERLGALRSFLRSCCRWIPKNCRERNVFGFFQHSTRVRDLRSGQPLGRDERSLQTVN